MMLRLTWLPVVCIALLCVSTAGAKTTSPLDAEQLELRWDPEQERHVAGSGDRAKR